MSLDQLQASMTLDLTNASINIAYNNKKHIKGPTSSGGQGTRGETNHRGGRGSHG